MRSSFREGCVLGFMATSTGELLLNPPDDMEVHEGDRLLLLTSQGMWWGWGRGTGCCCSPAWICSGAEGGGKGGREG